MPSSSCCPSFSSRCSMRAPAWSSRLPSRKPVGATQPLSSASSRRNASDANPSSDSCLITSSTTPGRCAASQRASRGSRRPMTTPMVVASSSRTISVRRWRRSETTLRSMSSAGFEFNPFNPPSLSNSAPSSTLWCVLASVTALVASSASRPERFLAPFSIRDCLRLSGSPLLMHRDTAVWSFRSGRVRLASTQSLISGGAVTNDSASRSAAAASSAFRSKNGWSKRALGVVRLVGSARRQRASTSRSDQHGAVGTTSVSVRRGRSCM
mmetsp:Transcript_24613/g.56835  ORF Transcript_24613/g.56835 Transcript_24613/m.56835 type:complete len:268 (+) Transcript_24613:1687-2490(+)